MNMYFSGARSNVQGNRQYFRNEEMAEQINANYDRYESDDELVEDVAGEALGRRKRCRCWQDDNFDWYECHRPYPPRLNCGCNCNPIAKQCGCAPVPTRRDDGKVLSVRNGEYVLVNPDIFCNDNDNGHDHGHHGKRDDRCCEQGVALPENLGLKAWSLRLEDSNTSLPLSSSVPYAIKLFIRKRIRVDQIAFNVISPAVSPVPGQNFVGLYAGNGALIAQSGDISSLYTNTGFNYAGIPSVWLDPGEYWVVFVSNASVAPYLLGSNLNSSIINAGLGGAYVRAGILSSGFVSLPSSFNPNALTPAQLLWVALD